MEVHALPPGLYINAILIAFLLESKFTYLF